MDKRTTLRHFAASPRSTFPVALRTGHDINAVAFARVVLTLLRLRTSRGIDALAFAALRLTPASLRTSRDVSVPAFAQAA